MALRVPTRRRLVIAIADAIWRIPDDEFFLQVHGLRRPSELATDQNLSQDDFVRAMSRLLWSLEDRQLAELAEDLWPSGPGTEYSGQPAEELGAGLAELKQAITAEPGAALSSARIVAELRETRDRSSAIAVQLRSELDSGTAENAGQWEFEASVLEQYVGPSVERVIIVIERVQSLGREATAEEVGSATAEISGEASFIRRVAERVSEPRVIGVVNLVLNLLRMFGVGS